MAYPITHLAATGGIAAAYWWWLGKKEKRWPKALTIAAILFFGVFIDVDHMAAILVPRGIMIDGYSGGGIEFMKSTVIIERCLWLHSAYAGIAAALLGKLLRSYLPFIAFLGHIALDISYNPAMLNMNKPIIRDFYLLVGWLGG